MAVSGKYGNVSIPNVGNDEPVFILRAQDRLALAAIEMYKLLAETNEAGIVSDLEKQIDAFRQWKGRRKSPD
ncbi:MAG: hypothetical protein BWZ01_01714 [Deltaproteobacteria bacterium ADurb.BinA179]|jgi:hypothetical protein|nr:hypothetical protein [Deltaproteobacteria bacterium]MDI9544147.1 hypothetical protein [Pseudomonadota bacterium]NLW67567.1 hypothetical protein [Bacteriovoracaceae bacterium]OPZ27282.1 MAG: hypothetical protein BWZ01_01714 [Deltaproteobacteria bacterium ADurb.BinA179]HRR21605.1 hypothetical protein [Desulfomonilia bacterium]